MKLAELVDRRFICLGIWLCARRAADLPVDDDWADAAAAAAETLRPRETWTIAGVALAQNMNVSDRASAARHEARLGAYRAALPPDPPSSDDETETDLRRQWRAATVHRWLLFGELLVRRRRAGRDVTSSWFDGVVRRGNPRSEDLRAGEDRPPAPPLIPAAAVGGLPVVEIEVDGDGPLVALPPGARWYPKFRTVSLHCAEAHLLVTGVGPANAVRSGPGIGSAIRDGAGHGNAIRRAGDGDAVRTGSGHGDAVREGTGEGLALRDGAGHGHALSLSLGQSRAERRGAGDGHAVAESGLGGAVRAGLGNGDAFADSGPALRSGGGAGDAVRRGGPFTDPPIDRRALRSGAGDGDAYGELDSAGVTLRTGAGRGVVRRWGQSVQRGWTQVLAGPRPASPVSSSMPSLAVKPGEPPPPVHRVQVIRSAEIRIPKGSPVVYVAETHKVLLDSEVDGTIEVIGAGALNVERRGAGRGDAVRLESGHGNVLRSGSGAGDAVRSGTGYGDARRSGLGVGRAVVGHRVLGRVAVASGSTGVCVTPAAEGAVDRWGYLGPAAAQ